jgi:hypothetical protein
VSQNRLTNSKQNRTPSFGDTVNGSLASVIRHIVILALTLSPAYAISEELWQRILSHLSSRKIAQLRLASQSFQCITKRMLERLIQEETPWFWKLELIEETYQRYCDALRLKSGITKSTKHDIDWLEGWEHLCILKKSIKGSGNRVRI